ncbi:hypothetical protein AAFN86_00670 [Roseomonas sp. CAU 1739]|uniref:hypothetical protein n=1 Tax=Roseomonas sp. CAU 1739 TaxID=3140364 RepID=UPI00325AD0E1
MKLLAQTEIASIYDSTIRRRSLQSGWIARQTEHRKGGMAMPWSACAASHGKRRWRHDLTFG